jgi:triosephosphate isomerase
MSKIIVANWKMNGSKVLVQDWVHFVTEEIKTTNNQVILLPPAILIPEVQRLAKYLNLFWGAQNCYLGDKGAFTGEISAKIFKEFGCEYILVGHSERRNIFGENNEFIKQKFVAINAQNLTPILCVGETENDYLQGKTFEALKAQLSFLKGLQLKYFIVAYEPVWAIGTGRIPSSEEIAKIHYWIKQYLLKECLLDESTMSIIYGGSVTSRNAESIMSLSDVDGVLVGGASLKPQEFLEIVTCIK